MFSDLFRYMKKSKKYWLIPILCMSILIGGLLVLTQGSAIAPFVYTIF